jgi:hypothetical protein
MACVTTGGRVHCDHAQAALPADVKARVITLFPNLPAGFLSDTVVHRIDVLLQQRGNAKDAEAAARSETCLRELSELNNRCA